MKKTVEKEYEVVCCKCYTQFPKVFKLEEGSESISTEVKAFCPTCDEMVKFTIKGEPEKVSYIRLIPKKSS